MPDRHIVETRDDEENVKITSTCKHVDERREDRERVGGVESRPGISYELYAF